MPDGPVELSDTMASSSSTGAGVAAARSMPKYASLVAAVLLISAPLVQRPVLGQSDPDLAPAQLPHLLMGRSLSQRLSLRSQLMQSLNRRSLNPSNRRASAPAWSRSNLTNSALISSPVW